MADRSMEAYKKAYAQDPARIAGWKIAGTVPSLLETIENAQADGAARPLGPAARVQRAGRARDGGRTPRRARSSSRCRTRRARARRSPRSSSSGPTGAPSSRPGSPFAPVRLPRQDATRSGRATTRSSSRASASAPSSSEAREITDGMVLAAAYALADYTARSACPKGEIYPAVDELNEVSIARGHARDRAGVRRRRRADDEGQARRAPPTTCAPRFWKPKSTCRSSAAERIVGSSAAVTR